MALVLQHYIDLPPHARPGGFDHAAVHQRTARLYVAHTCNDALDVIDCADDVLLHSIPNLTGIAGALVSDEHNQVFTSNRCEDTVGLFAPEDEAHLVKIGVGVHPNGLSYDPTRGLLLAGNVGEPGMPDSFTVSIVNVALQKMVAQVPVPGRTRWTVFDTTSDCFYVNIADPALVVVIRAADPTHIARALSIPEAGPHGLDLDTANRRLFIACDAKKLLAVDIATGAASEPRDLNGAPDVIFFNAAQQHLYVAIGDPGVIDVFDTVSMQRIETVVTEKGAHTIGYDATRGKVYAFLPQTHRAAVYADK